MRHAAGRSKKRFSSQQSITVDKTIISKRDLDALIRTHLQEVDCHDAVPLPVVWRARMSAGPNWAIPGWNGESVAVQRCVNRFGSQLRRLRERYDIPDEQ